MFSKKKKKEKEEWTCTSQEEKRRCSKGSRGEEPRDTKKTGSRRDRLLRYNRQVWRLVEGGLENQSTSGQDEVDKREGDRNNEY